MSPSSAPASQEQSCTDDGGARSAPAFPPAGAGSSSCEGPLDRPGRCADRRPCCWWCSASGPAVWGARGWPAPAVWGARGWPGPELRHWVRSRRGGGPLPSALLAAVDVGDPGVERVDGCCADAGPALLVANGAASPRPVWTVCERMRCAARCTCLSCCQVSSAAAVVILVSTVGSAAFSVAAGAALLAGAAGGKGMRK